MNFKNTTQHFVLAIDRARCSLAETPIKRRTNWGAGRRALQEIQNSFAMTAPRNENLKNLAFVNDRMSEVRFFTVYPNERVVQSHRHFEYER